MPQPDPVALRSELHCRVFTRYLQWYAGRHFHALRISLDGLPHVDDSVPLMICTNHPSWWDPAIFYLLMAKLFPGRRGFGPMDENALREYGLFRNMGIFGINPHSPRDAAYFMRTGLHILSDPRNVLWITAQGALTDIRQHPVRLRPGIAHLARRADKVLVLPLALDYPFWNHRLPEALVRFGEPILCGPYRSVPEWHALLEDRLAQTMRCLQRDAITREADRFESLLAGVSGISMMYDLYRGARAGWRHLHAKHIVGKNVTGKHIAGGRS